MPLPRTYRKLVGTKFTRDFREAAQIVEEELCLPSENEVLVRNRYAGVNASDINITSGKYFRVKEPPYDLGIETAGEVVAVGAGVKQFKVGDPVLTFVIGGGYREYLTTEVSSVYPVPRISPEVLALICSGLPASIGLEVTGQMKSGETVLVTAAAGGTGQFAVQLA
jgi:NADPH:quinone reductase-like Zn-dependent oxidoreductase